MGSELIAAIPASIVTIARTQAKMGRSIKNLAMEKVF
jgi:hypothetical protein